MSGVKYQVTVSLGIFSLMKLVGEKMLEGKVKSFDEQKGWGFITVPHEGEIFVHYSGIEGTHRRVLHPGQRVSLVIVQGKKGPQAAHVRILTREEF